MPQEKQNWKNKFKGFSHVAIMNKIELFVITLFIYVNCKNTWFIDYGASKHLTFWKGIFSTFEEFALGHKVYIGKNDILDIYVKKALLFLICQMECPNAFEMYPKVGNKYIIGKSINKTRFQGQIWNQKMLVEVFLFEQGGCSSYLSVDL